MAAPYSYVLAAVNVVTNRLSRKCMEFTPVSLQTLWLPWRLASLGKTKAHPWFADRSCILVWRSDAQYCSTATCSIWFMIRRRLVLAASERAVAGLLRTPTPDSLRDWRLSCVGDIAYRIGCSTGGGLRLSLKCIATAVAAAALVRTTLELTRLC